MKPIIRVEHVSKQFVIGKARLPYHTLRDSLTNALKAPFRLKQNADSGTETIWALKDVNFEVKPGEVLGFVGRNGAGKSTLLKILSRVTEPTTGKVKLYGRCGSLLEVGTGFHPELTGRENIFMNGAILGMRRREILRKFDEIVAFAEVERFINTPVKHFSSGMYLRLAFAVAAHLDPEILIVDEVLAVGDARFQRKCLQKMEDVGHQGRTVLFVSHNMPAIMRLCNRVLLVDNGKIALAGPPDKVCADYLKTGQQTMAAREWETLDHAPGDKIVRLRAVRLRASNGRVTDSFDVRESIHAEIEYEILKPGRRLSASIIVINEAGLDVFSSADTYAESIYGQDSSFTGRRVTTCEIPGNLMAEGSFTITVGIYAILDGIQNVHAPQVVGFRVVDPIEGDSARGNYTGPVAGVVRPKLSWTTETLSEEKAEATIS